VSPLAATLGRVLRVVQSKPARIAFVVVAVGLAVWALASRWDEASAALGRLDAVSVTAAVVATLANLVTTGLGWREVLADLGSRLPFSVATRVFFVGQVGKYVPGSLWPIVVQAEMAGAYGVPRRRTASASLVLLLLGAASALLVVLACLPFVPAVAENDFGWAVLLVVPMLVVLHPAVLGRVLDRGMRLLGRPPLGQGTTLRGTAAATAWTVLAWVAAGLQVWVLAVALGAPAGARSLALCIGGYALAWAVGLLVVVAPAGAGARELALAAVLSSILDGGAVVVVVLLSRVLFTLADLGLAGLGLLLARRPQAAARP